MTAISSAGWNGMGFVDDMHRGVLDRVLVSPVWRGALKASLLYSVITIALQALVIVRIGLAAGASFHNGVGGVAILILVACLLAGSVAALSKRPRATRAATGNADRSGDVRDLARHVPVVRVHAAGSRARLDPVDRAVQPGELGDSGGPVGGDARDGLDAGRYAHRPADGTASDQRDAGDDGVPRVPAVDLIGMGTGSDNRTPDWGAGALPARAAA
jgi:hypothetical protein